MKEFEPYIYVERDYDNHVNVFYALYVGEGLNKRYPEDYYFWLWLDSYKMWERHSIDKKADLRTPSKEELRDFVKYIFASEKWVIAL